MSPCRLPGGFHLTGAALVFWVATLGCYLERSRAFVLPHEVTALHDGIVQGMPVMKPKRAPASLHGSSAGDGVGGVGKDVHQRVTTDRTYAHTFNYTFESGTRAHFSYQVSPPSPRCVQLQRSISLATRGQACLAGCACACAWANRRQVEVKNEVHYVDKDDEPLLSSVRCDFAAGLGSSPAPNINVMHLTVQTSTLGASATRCDPHACWK